MGTEHMRNKVMIVDDTDKRVWGLITNVPHVNKPVAVVQAVVNFILPGFGTFIFACASPDTVSKTQLFIGLL